MGIEFDSFYDFDLWF